MRTFYSTNAYWIAFAIFAAITIPTILISFGDQHESVYETYATQHAKAEVEKKSFDKCFHIGIIEEFRSCVSGIIDTAREPQRSEEDVAAQKQMAFWAKWAVILASTIGFLTLIATVAGAVFFWRSIQDTRKQFAAENRPWISLSRPRVRISDAGNKIQFEISAASVGKTPALFAEVHIETIACGIPVPSADDVDRFASRIRLSAWRDNQKLIFPGRKRVLTPMDGDTIKDTKAKFVRVRYCVTYKANGSNDTHRTAGEVIFNPNSIDALDNHEGDWFKIARYVHYGVAFAD